MSRNPKNSVLADFFALVGKKLYALVKFDRINGIADPEATVKRIRNAKRLITMTGSLIAIIIIIILLLHGCQKEGIPHGSVDIPGNVIDPPSVAVTPEANLEFYNQNDEENLPFNAREIKDGYKESRIYRVLVTYNSNFVLKYDISLRDADDFKKLAEILNIKVELLSIEGDVVLYDGLLSSMEELELSLRSEKLVSEEKSFRVTAYLNKPLEDQYYGQSLVADMRFWIEEQDSISVANNEFRTFSPTPQPTAPDMNLININEGDNTSFDMKDIIEGSSESKYFAFEVTHEEDIKILIDDIAVSESSLSEALKIKIELVGDGGNTKIYEGSLKDFSAEHTVSKNESGKTRLYYKVTVTAEGLDKSVQYEKLACDLSWKVDGTSEELKISNNSFEVYKKNEPIAPKPPTPPETATYIELTAKEGYENIPFDVKNMLPGDSVEQYYCVSVTHDSAETVQFSVVLNTLQKLSEVLRIKVEQLIPDLSDIVLFEGLMKNCISADVSVTTNANTTTSIYYRITVYTNGSEVGNEYAGQSISADFSWQLK